MFCKFCGSQIDDDSVFCSKCGVELYPVAQAVPVALKSNTWKIILIIIAVAVVLVAGIIGGCIWMTDKVVSTVTVSGKTDKTASGESGGKTSGHVARNLQTASTFLARLPNGETIELLRIPKGEFMMGSPSTEASRFDNEVQHRVTLTKDFFLGKYEVTQAQWQAVMSNNPSYFKGPRRPVEQVSWNDAMQFCETLTAIGHQDGWLPENWKFTLPTEAQWEYACRAGTDTPFSYGSSSDASKMNFYGNLPYGGANRAVYRRSTVEVGSLGYRNNFGLYDMHGNVGEWCLDYYGSYSSGAVSDPVCVSGPIRVLRGGGWQFPAEGCRSASRCGDDPTDRSDNVGFRVALVEVQ